MNFVLTTDGESFADHLVVAVLFDGWLGLPPRPAIAVDIREDGIPIIRVVSKERRLLAWPNGSYRNLVYRLLILFDGAVLRGGGAEATEIDSAG